MVATHLTEILISEAFIVPFFTTSSHVSNLKYSFIIIVRITRDDLTGLKIHLLPLTENGRTTTISLTTNTMCIK